ncbi:cell adhesion molecule CEACAM6-like [Oncorhynchus clarkii lewisi]|uniref:cell adhesion molecule CEACAM6-like n=1 Tax=Oncorhynchus clarkii lewisi TaxID=490388 RepID=UPI0039B9AC6F
METAVAISLTLFILTGLCAGQGLFPQGSVNGAEGGTAMFITNLIPPAQPFIKISWSVGGANIITSTGDDSIGPGYGDRITLNKTTGSLQLRNLTLADSGEYRVSITTATVETINGSTELVVYENISDANITGPSNNLFADWSSANLTCEAAGNITTIQWTKEGQPLSAGGNILFSEENRKVSISPVKRHDNGEYVCKLTNPASSATASYRMIVNYGPESMTILGRHIAEVESFTLIYCSVQSVPPATFTWLFNGQQTGVHEAGYIIRSVSYNNSGDYRCDARNDLTENVVSMGHSLSVKDKTPPPLSPEGAAGIAVAVMLVVVAVALGLYFGITRHRGFDSPEDSSFTITYVEMTDAGNYTCILTVFPASSFEGSTSLTVLGESVTAGPGSELGQVVHAGQGHPGHRHPERDPGRWLGQPAVLPCPISPPLSFSCLQFFFGAAIIPSLSPGSLSVQHLLPSPGVLNPLLLVTTLLGPFVNVVIDGIKSSNKA